MLTKKYPSKYISNDTSLPPYPATIISHTSPPKTITSHISPPNITSCHDSMVTSYSNHSVSIANMPSHQQTPNNFTIPSTILPLLFSYEKSLPNLDHHAKISLSQTTSTIIKRKRKKNVQQQESSEKIVNQKELIATQPPFANNEVPSTKLQFEFLPNKLSNSQSDRSNTGGLIHYHNGNQQCDVSIGLPLDTNINNTTLPDYSTQIPSLDFQTHNYYQT